jgi:hypothetical protein
VLHALEEHEGEADGGLRDGREVLRGGAVGDEDAESSGRRDIDLVRADEGAITSRSRDAASITPAEIVSR